MAKASERFKYLSESWFLSEPAYFAIFCSHALVSNPKMKCAVRVGQGRLEYNPEQIESMSDEAFEESIKIEMTRLFLKHPYERTPAACSRIKMRMASDMTLSSHYDFRYHTLVSPEDFGLPAGKHYEWYLSNLTIEEHSSVNNNDDSEEFGPRTTSENNGGELSVETMTNSDDSQGNAKNNSAQGKGNSEKSDDSNKNSNGQIGNSQPFSQELEESAELWEEDECRQIEINSAIEKIKDWGTVPGNLSDSIIASTEARIDYRKILSGFRASVMSSRRSLTRMRPNRRSGFDHMGSKRDFSTKLLIAIDVSGSVTNDILIIFFSIIVRFFKYGIETMDVIQFDTQIQGELLSLEKVRKNPQFEIKGRGGTSFQCVFDFVAEHKEYDGLIIFTDGYAPEPRIKKGDRIRKVWVCDSEESYECANAVDEELIKRNPCKGLRIVYDTNVVTKEILTPKEIKKLASTRYKGEHREVQRAFIFCCYTGLRFCDVKLLCHSNVDRESMVMRFNQKKAEGRSAHAAVATPLNDELLKLIGEPSDGDFSEKIFNLPHTRTAQKHLSRWVSNAGISKKITWHCARHSFAVNLLNAGADIKTTSSLLGHASIKMTEKYLHVIDSRKQKAIDSLGKIDWQDRF